MGILILGACSAQHSPSALQFNSTQPITALVNSDLNKSSNRSMVTLRMRSEDGLYFHCSGALLADRIILTAAHCIDDLSPNSFIHVYRTTMNSLGKADIGWIGHVKSHMVHASYNAATEYGRNFDLALLKMNQNAPEDMVPYSLVTPEWLAKTNSHFLIAGSGVKDSRFTLSQKNSHEMETGVFEGNLEVIRGKDSLEITNLNPKVALIPGDKMVLNATGTKSAFTCSGDSGGALLEINKEGKEILVGVATSTVLKRIDNNTFDCTGQDMTFLPVSAFKRWILKTKEALEASP